MDMVRFTRKDDPGYEMVREDIQELIEKSPRLEVTVGITRGLYIQGSLEK
jgi:hypothetical protein